jgi:hypothetical protein
MNKHHVVVYRKEKKFAGWPANYGMWIWDNEIVVGFTECTFQAGGGFHARTEQAPAYPMQSRSLDGGVSWETTLMPAFSPGGRGFSADEHMIYELRVARAIELGLEPLPRPCPGGIDFTAKDSGILCARTGLGGGTLAWFYITNNRAHTWKGPYAFPLFGQSGIEARTDYIVNSKDECTFFLTAAREDGGEGAGVFLVRTSDGGKTFDFISWVARSEEAEIIMPSSIRVDSNTLLTAVRCSQAGGDFEIVPTWIDVYESTNNGNTWHFLSRPVENAGIGGNPPAMIRLNDGRVCLTYGYRAAPFGIRARLSSDGGKTWGEIIHLRDDGGCPDIGYPRTVQRPDGWIVTVYYFNDHPETERYIAATIWKP